MRLEPGERVLVRTRSHPRSLLGAAVSLVVTAFLLGLLMGVLARPGLPDVLVPVLPWLEGLVWGLAALALLLGTLRPLVRWISRRTVLTSRRLVLRAGLGSGSDAAMPLVSIADVQRRPRGSDAGDLHIQFQDPVRPVYWRLANVPEAERFEHLLAEVTRQARAASWPAAAAWGSSR